MIEYNGHVLRDVIVSPENLFNMCISSLEPIREFLREHIFEALFLAFVGFLVVKFLVGKFRMRGCTKSEATRKARFFWKICEFILGNR